MDSLLERTQTPYTGSLPQEQATPTVLTSGLRNLPILVLFFFFFIDKHFLEPSLIGYVTSSKSIDHPELYQH